MRTLLRSDVAKLAAKVTSLASLRLASITDGYLAALVGVEMSASASAVAVGRNRLLVEVVHEGTALGRKTRDGDSELDAVAILSRDGSDRTTDGILLLLRQSSNVRGALGVAADYGSRDDSGGLGGDSRRRGDERKD